MIDIAVMGCGAIAQRGYLPAIKELQNADLRWTVDVDEARARSIAAEFDSPGYATDYDEVLDETDAAIIATPPKFHAEITEACLRSNVHVLSEKPVALSSRSASELVALSEDRDLHFAVSRQYREAPACKLLRTFANEGTLGTIRDFEVRFGDSTNWGFVSEYRLRKSLSGGGAFTDKGAHMLDLILSIFDGHCEIDRYEDDSFGGLEANSLVELTVRPSGVTGTLEISGSRDIDDEVTITGERGRIVANPGTESATLHDFETGEEIRLGIPAEPRTTYLLRVGKQAKRFVESIETGEVTYVPARTAVDMLTLIEDCYESRELLVKPWETVGIDGLSGIEERKGSVETSRGDGTDETVEPGIGALTEGR